MKGITEDAARSPIELGSQCLLSVVRVRVFDGREYVSAVRKLVILR